MTNNYRKFPVAKEHGLNPGQTFPSVVTSQASVLT